MRDTTIRVDRSMARVEKLMPGYWTSETVYGGPALACPNCGRVDDIADEQVQPFACVACAWDGWVALVDWDEDVLR